MNEFYSCTWSPEYLKLPQMLFTHNDSILDIDNNGTLFVRGNYTDAAMALINYMAKSQKDGSIGRSIGKKTVLMYIDKTFIFSFKSDDEKEMEIYNKLKIEFDKIVALKAFW